jgi:hypothetical protein
MLLTTTVYFSQLIQVIPGRNLIFYGLGNIFNKPHYSFLLQLMRGSYSPESLCSSSTPFLNQRISVFGLICLVDWYEEVR